MKCICIHTHRINEEKPTKLNENCKVLTIIFLYNTNRETRKNIYVMHIEFIAGFRPTDKQTGNHKKMREKRLTNMFTASNSHSALIFIHEFRHIS